MAVLMGLSCLYDMTLLHMIFYGGISEAGHVTAANLKISFLCVLNPGGQSIVFSLLF